MIICGPSLSFGSSVPFQRNGGFRSESIWHKNCKDSGNLARRSISCRSQTERVCRSYTVGLTTFLTATAVIAASIATAYATYEPESTLSNIPQTLSGECRSAQDCKKAKIQKPKSRKAESCTIKCVTTCIRGGEGSPGEGPLNVTRYKIVTNWIYPTRQQLFFFI